MSNGKRTDEDNNNLRVLGISASGNEKSKQSEASIATQSQESKFTEAWRNLDTTPNLAAPNSSSKQEKKQIHWKYDKLQVY